MLKIEISRTSDDVADAAAAHIAGGPAPRCPGTARSALR